MAMRKIPFDQLRSGMKFTKSLFDKNLNIILPAGKSLDDDKLKNMRINGIEYVETAGDLIDDEQPTEQTGKTGAGAKPAEEKKKILVDKETAKYIELYKEIATMLGYLYGRYRDNQGFDPDKIQKIANRLVNAVMVEKNLNSFINLINITARGDYLYSHLTNTSILSVVVGKHLGYSMAKLVSLAMGGMLFDIGMLKIPAYIIEKESKLSPEERNLINTHPVYSYQIISREFNLPVEIARIGLEHHERWDGTGYPRKIKGPDLSEMSRIVSIVDTYEAITKNRVYREKKESYDAMKEVLSEGSKRFDPELLKMFLNIMSVYPVGSYVRLNNNAIARVMASDPVSPFRPTVKIVIDEFGDKVEDGELIRLSKEKEIYIIKAVTSATITNPTGPTNEKA